MNSFVFCFISKEITSEQRPCSSSDIHMVMTYRIFVCAFVCICVCVHDCHHDCM